MAAVLGINISRGCRKYTDAKAGRGFCRPAFCGGGVAGNGCFATRACPGGVDGGKSALGLTKRQRHKPLSAGRRVLEVLSIALLALFAAVPCPSRAQALNPTGAQTFFKAIDPTVQKWYRPQQLYHQYKWDWWQYSNYARIPYQRYVNTELEGTRWYDLYGNYVTEGWLVYRWTQEQPTTFGSDILKSSRFNTWFNRLVVTQAQRGQYYFAVTVGDEIRTTLTPFTFSKPAFNGVQVDFQSDKYAATLLMSRANLPIALEGGEVNESKITDFNNLFGFRSTFQVGDFVKIGGTYVNSHLGRTSPDLSLAGIRAGNLTTEQNRDVIRQVQIRISDDSPEDGEGGAILFSERVFVNAAADPLDIAPLIEGGTPRRGTLVAEGAEQIVLTYAFSQPELIRKLEFELVLANDFLVEVNSNLQTNFSDQPVFLPVSKAPGNVKDGSNQRVVRFDYGLPTANEIYGVTLEVQNIAGLNVAAEWDINKQWRRLPNVNFERHVRAANTAQVGYLTARTTRRYYPWFAYGEIFSVDQDYATFMYVQDHQGKLDYTNKLRGVYEFVDDNDDQDRFPDWRRAQQPNESRRQSVSGGPRGGIFPGLDENNDFISDFNQNDNTRPDYDEPFLRYKIDPPEFLFGIDMDNNTLIDRFEDDDEADYPFRRDQRGYNGYFGLEVKPGIQLLAGCSNQWLLSDERSSRSSYLLFKMQQDRVDLGRFNLFYTFKLVEDDIIDDQLFWTQPPGTFGVSEFPFEDPMLAQDAVVHSAFFGFDRTWGNLNTSGKFKYEAFIQRGDNFARLTRPGEEPEVIDNFHFVGLLHKLDYSFPLTEVLVFQPKLKSMYRRQTAYLESSGNENNLSEILFLTFGVQLMPNLILESGAELTKFWDFADVPGGRRDFWGWVGALQLSVSQAYLGYHVTINLGTQVQQQRFKSREQNRVESFLAIFAGLD